jgi:D-aminopeptidase
VGLAQVGGHGVERNHYGEIILAISTANKTNEIISTPQVKGIAAIELNKVSIIKNESIDAIFRAASEATEEAIINSMSPGRTGRTGCEGRRLEGFPTQRVKELLQRYRVVV